VTPGLRRLTLAIAAAVTVAGVPSAGAHEQASGGRASAQDISHSDQHERVIAGERAARRRWERLTPAQRAAQIGRAERETQALNAALAARPRDDTGYWEPALRPLPDYAIHASVLPTGKVLIFGREPLRSDNTRFNLGSARVFDPVTGSVRHVPPPPLPENEGRPAAIYCSGQALLSDGRVLLAGGNLSEPDPANGKPAYAGLKRTFLFDPWTETWSLGPSMGQGRWYPTLTKLDSGDVLILSGYNEEGQGVVNPRMEIYRPQTGALQVLPGGERGPFENTELPLDARAKLSLYPDLFLLPDGDVALAGPGKDDRAILDTKVALDQTQPRGSAWIGIPIPPSQHHYGGSPVLEPDIDDYDGAWNVVNLGGADDNGDGFHLARATIDRLTAGPGTPVWNTDPALVQERFYPNAVLLPDGGIVTVGGGIGTDNVSASPRGNFYLGPDPPPELKQVELRRPGPDATWRLGAAQQEWRTYHSIAALLADGRVMSAGDDGHEGPDPELPLPDEQRRDSAEIYWPPYLFDGDRCALRPEIRSVASPAAPPTGGAWATLDYGATFGIFSEHAQPGMRAVLVAPAAVTHSVDMNQRLVSLQVRATIAGGGLNVTAPAGPAIAPPGYYMLFVVDAAGTPSVARWVRLAAGAGAAAPVTGPRPGPKGRRCIDPDGTVRSEPDPADPQQSQPQPEQPQPPQPQPPQTQPQPGAATAKRSSKLALDRATIDRARRRLDVSAQISALATGRVRFELLAAGRRTRLSAAIRAGQRRISLRGAIPAAQARLGTGILTISYGGDGATRPLSVRLRAARTAAALRPARPAYSLAGLLRAAGTISRRARGVVRVQVQFEHEGRIETVVRSAKVVDGRWNLRSTLPGAVRRKIAARSGTLDAYVLFTGDQGRRMRGEMRSYQILGEP